MNARPWLSSFSFQVFRLALPGGIAALLIGAVAALMWRRSARRPAPVAGLLLVAAAGYGLARVPGLVPPAARRLNPLWGLPGGLGTGLFLLASAGFAAEFLRARRSIGAVLAVAGAWVIATDTALPAILWIRVAIAATTVLGGILLADLDRRWRNSALAVPLVVVAVAGVFGAVPETTQAAVLLASAAPLTLLARPWPVASIGAPWAFATVGLIAWTAAAGGIARPPSIIGGLGCLGLIIVEPLVRTLDPIGEGTLDVLPARLRIVGAIAAQVTLACICARVAARSSSVVLATAMTTGANVAAAAMLAGGLRIARRLRAALDSS